MVSTALAVAAVTSAVLMVAAGHLVLIGLSFGAAILAWLLRPEPDPSRWRRGADGEVATARLLAALPRRFIVTHDRRVPGSRANIDHLVIGPTGVWVIDSKSFRARVRVRRGQVLAGDHVVDTGPVAAQAALLQARCGHQVRALVAVHGIGLRRRGTEVDGVRVLPAGQVSRMLRRGRRQLARATVTALSGELGKELPPAAGTYH